jgi:hypothetical protein
VPTARERLLGQKRTPQRGSLLRVNDKYIKEHSIFNMVGIIITTNYKTNGLYLPADE